ncbi:Dyp-type peroxidase [Nocardia sp. BMG51109]|uniref:Dyp-type peroxidase n=1 Tax=Nocardia sp. BMG51109 TaxID=1056816 RepID=UPI000467422F|nr:Dyp-type peroxidase [Nocardia sp. BMG51109]
MGEPQPILDPLTRAAIFLVATIDEGGEPAIRDLLADLSGLRRSVGFRLSGSDLTCCAGIGSAAWDRLFAGPRPAELHEFPGYDGDRHEAPATPGDLLFHIRAESQDACFELAMAIGERLRGAATIVDETIGFRYLEMRDLLGFVDGTENPEGRLAQSAAIVGAEDPDFAGGSYVVVQKYTHDLDTWNALPVDEQEHVIGRTKLSDFELSDEEKPLNSHVAVNTLYDADGNQLQIVRANMPFGSVQAGEFGTYYIAYAATPTVIEQMLERMFLGSDEAAYDRILDFSTAVTGTLFFAPSTDFLDDPPEAPESELSGDIDPGDSDPGDSDLLDDLPDAAPTGDGSLGIGTLKSTQA